MLELKGICKSYTTGDFTQKALNNVSVTFRDSEFVAVLGPSGSGKTTLLNVIGGLAHYDGGDLLINGKSTKQFSDHDWDHYRNNQVGFVFQNYNLIPHQSILANVELALTLSGISKDERKSRATKALEEVGLSEHIQKKPNQLSGGQQQRVAIARAIVNDPNIIFADEPTGALDTKTSIQIMDILKKISADRLVVMVTHNPEIAEKYATRIVNLQDAKIVGDSMPLDVKAESKNKFKKVLEKGKTAMSFATALSLSFANLMGKKGRTFMTAFAGSIGIIGISGILALSTGTNLYIKNVENNTLSQYPLSITRSKSFVSEFQDMTNGGNLSDMISEMRHNNQEENKIGIRDFLSKMLATSGNNDLKSLKAFLETNPDGLNDDIDSIEYTYAAQPIIYADDIGGIREVAPAGTFSSLSAGSSGSSYTSASQNYSGGGMSTLSGFTSLPKNDNLYKDKYSVAAGRWPQNSNECVLVLHQDGTINDSMLYTLGLRDNQEMLDAIQNYTKDEKVNLPSEFPDITYDDVLGRTFKIIHACDLYEYDSAKGIWIDKSSDTAYMQQKVRAAQDLKIVGIINPPEGNNKALALIAGINYPYQLVEECINYAWTSQIVADQLAKPDTDVLTGKTFAEQKKNLSFDTSAFMPSINFDVSNFTDIDVVSIIGQAITSQSIQQIIEQSTILDLKDDKVRSLVIAATDSYVEWAAKAKSSATPEKYFKAPDGEGYHWIQEICVAANVSATPAILQGIQGIVANVVNGLATAIGQKMQAALGSLSTAKNFSISKEQLMQLSKLISGTATRTYDSNLADFGYADLNNPLGIILYPNDFYAKERISDRIDNYNTNMEQSGHEEKVISYTDYAKLLMSSITTMIDMITAVLVAFVAISLVVSSIMIGIITYISVLERRREIGILRAIGARKRDIFNVFNAETFIIGLFAGFIGILVTAFACIPANMIARSVFNVEYDIAILPLWAAVILIVISVFLTFVAGLIPSTSASKKDPVEAINS